MRGSWRISTDCFNKILIRGDSKPRSSAYADLPEARKVDLPINQARDPFPETAAPRWGEDEGHYKGSYHSESLSRFQGGRNPFSSSVRPFGVNDAHLAVDAGDEIASLIAAKSDQHMPPKQNRRTILLKNLPDRATHKDIVGEIYGGLLLDVFLRPQDKSASVSFVETNAAEEFLAHVKRNDLYVHGRRVCCPVI